MKKEMTIVYDVHDGLYINLTNRCPCAWHLLPAPDDGYRRPVWRAVAGA